MTAAPLEIQEADTGKATADALATLWQRCGLTRPWNDPHRDIAFALSNENATILEGRIGGTLAASAMVGHDGHRGTVYYVAVDPDRRGHGYGRAIMAAAEAWLKQRGVWKLNLLVRTENTAVAAFYQALGYQVEERVALAKRLEDS